jgi:hypothetical protein
MAGYRSVEIEGTLTPAAGVLPRGERKVVAYTDRIAHLVQRGHIKVVKWLDEAVEAVEVEETPGGTGELVPAGPPAKNASREDWAEWIAAQPDLGIVTEGKGRDTLIDEYEAWVEGQQGATDGDESDEG